MTAIPMTLSALFYYIAGVGQMTSDLSIKCKAKTEDNILLKITLYIMPHFNFHGRQPENNVDLCRHKSLRFKVYTIR